MYCRWKSSIVPVNKSVNAEYNKVGKRSPEERSHNII